MRRDLLLRTPRADFVLFALILAIAATAVFALVTGEAESTEAQVMPQTESVPGPPEPVAEHVTTVRPALKADLPDGVSDEILEQVRAVPGVAAAAGLLLSKLKVEAPQGETEVSVAGVRPDEFRPLAPELTAQAGFVWEGLNRFESFIANEEYQIFGGNPIQSLAAEAPEGRRTLRIGGVASNGSPSFAGVLMSMDQAERLKLGKPTLLVVGIAEGANVGEVTTNLEKAVPGARFESMLPPSGRTFFTGASAQKAIGSFSFTVNPDGTINQDRKWVSEHLATERMPIIGNVRCHKVMLPQLRAALEEIQSQGLAHLLKPEQAGRCYQPRFVEKDPVNHALSKHAWGLAIDLNVYDNPEGSTPKMDPRIVAIFEKWGFRWGGRWTKPDGMHFELAALLRE
ncbi:MAG TPA: M15 family metallopeptidase [Actinomycetota bacterium]|nr:M15 family metallopeptidase [Actinomycetota bacterium]